MCLLFEPFGLWWAEHEQPTLRERPLVIVKAERVLHANHAARREGIIPGLPLVNARLRTPNLALAEAADVQLQSRWTQVLEQLHAWSPWLLSGGLGRAWLQVDAAEAKQLAREFQVRAGSAPSRELALTAALTSQAGELRQVTAGQERAFLDTLPVSYLEQLGLLAAAVARLEHLGVRHVGELRKWSRVQLRAVLGAGDALILPLLASPEGGSLPVHQPERNISLTHAFPDPAGEAWVIGPALRHLAERLSERLGQEVATRVTLTAESSGLQLLDEVVPKAPVARAAVLERLLQRSLQRSGALSLGFGRLTVTLGGLARLQEQQDLWPQRQAREQAIKSVNRRFPGALLTCKLLDPYSLARDQRYRLVPLTGSAPVSSKQERRTKHAANPAARDSRSGSSRRAPRVSA